MFNDVLTPSDKAFFDWNYTAAECIEQLKQLRFSTDVDLSFLEEWIALSLETLSVAYYKQDDEIVVELIEAMSAAFLSVDPASLSKLQRYPFLLHNGLRAVLSQTQQHPEPNHLVQLYRLLPILPKVKTFDIHVMFQCYFGFANILNRWYERFDYYSKSGGWLEYNFLQLETARELVAGRMYKEHLFVEQLNEKFPKYILSIEDRPLAAEWFPWFLWFVLQRA